MGNIIQFLGYFTAKTGDMKQQSHKLSDKRKATSLNVFTSS